VTLNAKTTVNNIMVSLIYYASPLTVFDYVFNHSCQYQKISLFIEQIMTRVSFPNASIQYIKTTRHEFAWITDFLGCEKSNCYTIPGFDKEILIMFYDLLTFC